MLIRPLYAGSGCTLRTTAIKLGVVLCREQKSYPIALLGYYISHSNGPNKSEWLLYSSRGDKIERIALRVKRMSLVAGSLHTKSPMNNVTIRPFDNFGRSKCSVFRKYLSHDDIF
jgi:hypothetical protein